MVLYIFDQSFEWGCIYTKVLTKFCRLATTLVNKYIYSALHEDLQRTFPFNSVETTR